MYVCIIMKTGVLIYSLPWKMGSLTICERYDKRASWGVEPMLHQYVVNAPSPGMTPDVCTMAKTLTIESGCLPDW